MLGLDSYCQCDIKHTFRIYLFRRILPKTVLPKEESNQILERDDRDIIASCFSKVFQKKALLSARVYAEIFEQVPATRDVMQDEVSQQKEGFISILIETMKTPQTGDAAQKRMNELRAMHVEMSITSQQVKSVMNIIRQVLKEELVSDLTPVELSAWQRSIQRFALDLSAGLR